MQLRKILGLTLLYLGIIIVLFGLLALALPSFKNQQVQMIIASFEAPASNAVLGFVNRQFLNMIHYAVPLSFVGGALMLLGGMLLFLGLARKEPGAAKPPSQTRIAKRAADFMPPIAAQPDSSWQEAGSWRRNASPLSLKDEFTAAEPTPLFVQSMADPVAPFSGQESDNPYLSYGQNSYARPIKAKITRGAADAKPQEDVAEPSPFSREAAVQAAPVASAALPAVSVESAFQEPMSVETQATPALVPALTSLKPANSLEASHLDKQPELTVPKQSLSVGPALSAARPLLPLQERAASTPTPELYMRGKLLSEKPQGPRTSKTRRAPVRIRSTMGRKS